MSIIIHSIFAIFRDQISFMLPFTESFACVQKIGYAISRTFQPYSFLLYRASIKKAQPPPWRLRFYAKYARAKSDSLTSLFLLRSCCTDRPISQTGRIRYPS